MYKYWAACVFGIFSNDDPDYNPNNEEIFDTEIISNSSWTVKSIYEFIYFNCPGCIFKCKPKQEFVDHLHENHPESISTLKNISDESLRDKWSKNFLYFILLARSFTNSLNYKVIIWCGFFQAVSINICWHNPWNCQLETTSSYHHLMI